MADETPTPHPRPRLALIVSHPIQHFCPMYRQIAADGRIDLLVLFVESGAQPRFDAHFSRTLNWQPDILEGYPHRILAAPAAQRRKAVLAALETFAPDAIYVHGYALSYLRSAILWANRRNIPVLMATDSELKHTRPWHVRAFKRLFLPRLLSRIDLFLTVGDENERYFAHYGVPTSRFLRTPFSIDSEAFDCVLAERDRVRNKVRAQLNVSPEATVILTVGKLIPRKQQAHIVQAMRTVLASSTRSAVLLLAGDGPDRVALEALARPLGEAIKFLGFIEVDRLPEYYVAADLYVQSSNFDPHPLAVSEALYCGLPVIASDRIGSIGPSDDLQEGRTGWAYLLTATFPL